MKMAAAQSATQPGGATSNENTAAIVTCSQKDLQAKQTAAIAAQRQMEANVGNNII